MKREIDDPDVTPIDPLEKAALRIAEGHDVDWGETLDLSPESEQLVANLRRLQRVFQALSPATPAEGQDPSPPARVRFEWGHLQVRERLGEGSFGEVFRAYDPILEREVALKLRAGDAKETAEQSRHYIREARRLARVRHPNVLAIHGADRQEGRVGLWADLLEGRTLEEVIVERAPLPPSEVVEIATGLARALAEVHRAGLVHCDVKASNVMLEPQVGPVLMDFGAGVDVESQDRPLFGSPLSMAPEQFDGSVATPMSDQYSLGVLLYRLLTGDYPLHADSFAGLAEQHRAGSRTSLPPAVPRSLRRLVSSLLSPEPSGRPTADDTVKAVDWIANAPVRRRRVAALALVFTSLLAGTVLATVGYVRAQRSESRAIAAQSESEAINQFLTEMLMSPRGSERGPEVKMVDVLEHAEDDLDRAFSDQPLAQSQALNVLGRTWRYLGERERSVTLLRRGLDLRLQGRDETDPGVLALKESLAASLRELGEVEEAATLLEEVLAHEDALDPDSNLRVTVRNELAQLAQRQGEVKAAERWYEQALDLRRGERWRLDHNRRLVEGELGGLLADVGQLERAVEVLSDLLPRQLEAEGERDHNTLVVIHEMAKTLTRLGRYQEAESHFQRALEIASEWLGDESTQSQMMRTGLANVYHDQGRYRDAAPLLGRLLEVFRRTESRPSHNLLTAVGNYGNSLTEAGDFEGAQALLEEAIQLGTEDFGATYPATLIDRFNLAELHYRAGRPAAAMPIISENVSDCREALGPDHLVTLIASALEGAVIGALTEEPEEWSRAEELLRHSHDELRNNLGEDSVVTMEAGVFLAELLIRKGACDQARPILLDFKERAERLLVAEHWLRGWAAKSAQECH